MSLGTLYTVSAPSGAGKTTLVKRLRETQNRVVVSTSHTTRAMRPGEQNGVDYHFVSEKEFSDMIAQGAFLEHAQVFRNFYGTAQSEVEKLLEQGKDVILEIDWQGMQQVKRQCPDCIAISIVPPSLDVLAQRLKNRDSDSNEEIEHRMAQAQKEIEHYVECDYLVINDDLDVAMSELVSILSAQRNLVSKQAERHKTLLQALLN